MTTTSTIHHFQIEEESDVEVLLQHTDTATENELLLQVSMPRQYYIDRRVKMIWNYTNTNDDEYIGPAFEAVEALRDAIGALKSVMMDDETCDYLKSRMLDEEVSQYDVVIAGLTSIAQSELLKGIL